MDSVCAQGAKSCWRHMPIVGGIFRLYEQYDASFLTLLGMQYFNCGTKVMVYLASCDLFKSHYKLDPSRVQSI